MHEVRGLWGSVSSALKLHWRPPLLVIEEVGFPAGLKSRQGKHTSDRDRSAVLAKPRPCEHKSLIKASEEASFKAEGGQPMDQSRRLKQTG